MAETGTGAPNFDDLGSFTKTVQAGDFVFRQGDAATTVFIVQDGSVELIVGEDGPRLALVDTGSVFGEASFFSSTPRDCSAKAVSDVRVIHLDRVAFDRVTSEAPRIAVSLIQQLARRVGDQQATLRDALSRASASTAAPAAVETPRGLPKLVEAESGTEFSLDGVDEATVGRPDRATGFTPEVDLTALDVKRALSRRHAKLVRRDDRFFVREEAGTRNGTFVNGVRITTGTELELHDGDHVQFGFVKTVFQWR